MQLLYYLICNGQKNYSYDRGEVIYMCGIAGLIDYKNSPEKYKDIFEDMKSSLARRGPDSSGIFMSEGVGLIHSRLSVIDMENGKQPMISSDDEQDYIIVYNGELYNTEELRKELKNSGFEFSGHSDTEVLLKSYIKWKDRCVEKFNGIFAFAIWEEKSERLFIARDRIGVKPFFYSDIDGEFFFGSEIKAILASKKIKPQIDLNSVCELILIGPGRTQGYGIFKNIKELPPASCGYYTREGLKIRKYWYLRDKVHYDNLSQTVEHVKYLVTDSIERQLVSDVPVSTFLSGGLDSSIISSVADRYFSERGEKLHTFSVDYIDNDKYFKKSKFQPNSDESFIDIMANYLNGTNHRVVLDSKDVAKALFEAVDARDLPGMVDVDSSLLLFCREIKKYSTVALSGECADEIFGGYPWYRDETIRMTDGFPWAQSTSYRAGFLNDDIANKINPDEYVYEKYKSTLMDTDIRPGISKTEKRMKEMMRLNLDWFMMTLLDRKDRMSMYSALEVRVPFCDYRIAEYLYNVPWEYKEYNHMEKGLLRKAMEDYLPDEVLYRKKSPYPKTHNPVYLEEVSKMLRNVICDKNSPLLQIVKKDKLQELLQSDNSVPWYGQLMTTPQTIAYFVQMDYWLRKYDVDLCRI